MNIGLLDLFSPPLPPLVKPESVSILHEWDRHAAHYKPQSEAYLERERKRKKLAAQIRRARG